MDSVKEVLWWSFIHRRSFIRRVKPEDAQEIFEETILKGKIIDSLLYDHPTTGEKIVHEDEVPFYKKQMRIIFGNNGSIDPTSIEDYIAVGGYRALSKGPALHDARGHHQRGERSQSEGTRRRGIPPG